MTPQLAAGLRRLRFCAWLMLAVVSCKKGDASSVAQAPGPRAKMVLTLNNDDSRYRGAATLSGIGPQADVAKDLRMSTYPAVLTADGSTLAYLHVSASALELRMFRPGTPPRVLLTFDEQNDGSPRLAWSPDGSRLALIEMRLAPNEDWRHPRTRLTVLDVSPSGHVTRRFERPINAYFAELDELVAPMWKDNQIVAYESMQDGARGPMVDVVTVQ